MITNNFPHLPPYLRLTDFSAHHLWLLIQIAMKNQKQTLDLKGRTFNGNYYSKIKRIRTEPRQRIRQLLRSFIPLDPSESQPENDRSITQ